MRDDGKRSRFESHRKRKKRKLQKRVVRDLFFDEGSGIGSALFSSRQKGFFGAEEIKNGLFYWPFAKKMGEKGKKI